MKITGTLLVASLLALAALTASAYPQGRQPNEKEMLNMLTLDIIKLQDKVTLLQSGMDQKGATLTKLVESLTDRIGLLDQNLQKLNDTLGGIRTENQKHAGDLQNVRTLVETLKGTIQDVGESVNGLNRQLGSMSDKITKMSTKEEVLPTAAVIWSQAFSDYSGGNYAIAISEFKEFLTQFPRDERAANVQVYIGKSYAAQKQYDQAELAFDEALQKYPGSDQTCAALYGKGLTQREQKKIPEARATLQQAVKDCPAGSQESSNAAAALKALPARE